MRSSLPDGFMHCRSAVLDQASAALSGRRVALWRVAREGRVVAELACRPDARLDEIEFDIVGTLRQWGCAVGDDSLWLGCRIAQGRWCIAPVRIQPAAAPSGIERRSAERLTLALAGVCLGAIDRVWAAADQATVYLSTALDALDRALCRVRELEGLSTPVRAHMLADLAIVAEAIEGALSG